MYDRSFFLKTKETCLRDYLFHFLFERFHQYINWLSIELIEIL
jgi:hypothetical protein